MLRAERLLLSSSKPTRTYSWLPAAAIAVDNRNPLSTFAKYLVTRWANLENLLMVLGILELESRPHDLAHCGDHLIVLHRRHRGGNAAFLGFRSHISHPLMQGLDALGEV